MGLAFFPLTAGVVVPASCDTSGDSCATFEGDSNNGGFSTVGRYQQIFDYSAFPGPITIRSMLFRRDWTGSSFDVTYDLEVYLEATTHGVLLADSYETNYGTGAPTKVFGGAVDGAAVHLVSDSIGSPRPFDAGITFSTPFLYDPSAGNLLVEIRNTTLQAIVLDGVDDYYNGQRVQNLHGAIDEDPASVYGGGLVIEFSEGAAAPEPGTISLLLAGIALAGIKAFRRG
jgi:hypothetical protein